MTSEPEGDEVITRALLLGCNPRKVFAEDTGELVVYYAAGPDGHLPSSYGDTLREVCANWLYVNGYGSHLW